MQKCDRPTENKESPNGFAPTNLHLPCSGLSSKESQLSARVLPPLRASLWQPSSPPPRNPNPGLRSCAQTCHPNEQGEAKQTPTEPSGDPARRSAAECLGGKAHAALTVPRLSLRLVSLPTSPLELSPLRPPGAFTVASRAEVFRF